MSSRALGIVMLVVGVVLLFFGLNATDSVSDTVSEGVTGRYTDETMWYLIGGAALAIGGALMAFFGRRTSKRL
jgi:uncharacterized membrane protein